uniref:Non-specific serine/threonine protein kinase n=1 Tax=Bursaphelenchus xylophilus TaxID=6326 RepID=A0A1I7S218_BURXY
MEKNSANETAELIFQAIHYRNADLLTDLTSANQSILGHIRASDGRTPLHFAAAHGVDDCVRVLCDYVDVDAVTSVDEGLKTALLLAAQAGHVETVRILIQQGADPFFCDANGYSALQLAHLNNHGRVAEVLFESIDNIKKESERLNKELCSAIEGNNFDRVLDLLAQSTNFTQRDILASGKNGEKAPLYIACEKGFSGIIGALLSLESNPLVDPPTGNTLLHAVIQSGDLESTKLVLEQYGEQMDVINNSKELPFHFACSHGNVEIVKFRIKKNFQAIHYRNADLLTDLTSANQSILGHIRASDGRTPLHFAAAHGVDDCVRVLCDYVDVDAVTSVDEGLKTALLLAAQAGHVETVRILIQQGADPFFCDANGYSALQLAHLNNHGRVAEVLFESIDNIKKESERLNKELCSAIEGNNFDRVLDLLAQSTNFTQRDILASGKNGEKAPLYIACEKGFSGIIGALLSLESNPLVDPPTGNTLLHAVIQSGDLESTKLVLEQYGEQMDVINNSKELPFHFACSHGNVEIVKLVLLENGADVNLPIAITDLEIANLRADEARCIGSGALIEAAQCKNVELVKRLFFHGAVDYDNQALRQASKQSNSPLLTVFLEQLTFTDSENRIHLPESGYSAMDRLKSMDLLPVLRPNVPCRLDWQNAGLERLGVEFMMAAALRFNPRVRNLKMALSAITRIDLADNSLTDLPEELFQLSSLKILNLDHNKLEQISMPRTDFACPFLESLSVEANELDDLPSELFSPKHFPSLKSANFCKNKLRRLPGSIWKHPTLNDLNLSDNLICDLSTPSPERSRREPRQRATRNPYVAAYHSSRALVERKKESELERRREKPAEIQKQSSVNVQKNDVLRSNIWQTELNMAVVEDDDPKDDPNNLNSTNALRSLNLSGNKLRSVPECLACFCPRLTKLDLSRNDLSSLKAVECFPATLKTLNLANNRLAIMFRRAEGQDLSCFVEMIAPNERVAAVQTVSVNRHSRSRSKSVARNQQRSLSIIRANKETENTNLCSHKAHCRLENLKSLNLSNNKLAEFDLFIPFEARTQGLDISNWRDSNDQFRPYIIFPALTNLDLSSNDLKSLPPTISLLSQLAVLNLSQNKSLERLPVELGLLEKLWGVQLNGCALKDPLKGIVGNGNFKTMDLISFLRHELDNSKPHRKLKLMFLGRSEVGKSALLSQMRAEGHVAKVSLNSESWAHRMGHAASKSFSRTSMRDQRRAPLDVGEWMYEPPKSSKTLKSNGPVTLRTWDFEKLQKEFQQVPQAFLSRRSIVLVVWKLTDGEIAINEIHDWLLAIQSRAPNATVIIVGTHLDAVQENIQRFPDDYLQNFEKTLQQRFVNVPDADKKGLPRVVASVFVSTKNRNNVQQLCELVYCASQQVDLNWKGVDYSIKTCPKQATKFLASLVEIIDDLLEDWFPSLGTRFVHSSDGQLLVDRLIPCAECASAQSMAEKQWRRDRKTSDPEEKTPIHLFSVEECILAVYDEKNAQFDLAKHLRPAAPTHIDCPLHGRCDLEKLAPDVCFVDLNPDIVHEVSAVKRGKLLGQGAFGSVYSGFVKSNYSEVFEEVALKILEPTSDDPNQRLRVPSNQADRLESVAKFYYVARQELNMLCDLQHPHITLLVGFSRPPITLLMELAPHGALDQLLGKYRKSDVRLAPETLQLTCAQISKALEFLHSNHIIYRDLKAENVLVWRFPLPRQKISPNNVHVKLGDYGISRFSYPLDVCKGYGGTEGFMAPEILKFNGEFEYTEKVDCYSFGMFVYELITLHHPYDGHEQMKDCIFEGQRPMLNEKDILCPSNVLDLMVTCWADDSAARPSSSDLVTITTAPEFTHLADVATLQDHEMTTLCTLISATDECTVQLWLAKEDGDCTVMSLNQFGFIENETIGPFRSKQVTALAEVGRFVWIGNASGDITVYSPKSYSEQASFQIDSIDPSLTKISTIRSIKYCPINSSVLICLPQHVLLCACPGTLPQHLCTIKSDEILHTAILLQNSSDWQIWTAHDDARIVTHYVVKSTSRLLYSASSHHPNASGNETPTAPRVKFLIPSCRQRNAVFSALENDGRVFQWENGTVRRTLDCSRILPVSESLSSMFDEEQSQRCKVTAMECQPTQAAENLLVGTQNGVLIILEAQDLTPLTSFRTYEWAVETILAPTTLGWMKHEEFQKMDQQNFFVTIGKKYRCV